MWKSDVEDHTAVIRCPDGVYFQKVRPTKPAPMMPRPAQSTPLVANVTPEVVRDDHDDPQADHTEDERPVPARARLRALLPLWLDLVALAGSLLAGSGLRHGQMVPPARGQPGTIVRRSVAAASTAARVNGSDRSSPAAHAFVWSFQCGEAGLPDCPVGRMPMLVVEVGQVVDDPPRGDDADVERAVAFESGLVHGLIVASERVLGGDEQRLEAGHAPERMGEPGAMDVAPAPRRGVRPHRLGAPVPGGGECLVELLLREVGRRRAAPGGLGIGTARDPSCTRRRAAPSRRPPGARARRRRPPTGRRPPSRRTGRGPIRRTASRARSSLEEIRGSRSRAPTDTVSPWISRHVSTV